MKICAGHQKQEGEEQLDHGTDLQFPFIFDAQVFIVGSAEYTRVREVIDKLNTYASEDEIAMNFDLLARQFSETSFH
jgi:hypothetical protein